MITVTSPFYWYHTVALTFDISQGQICCRAGDHNSSNLLVVSITQLNPVLDLNVYRLNKLRSLAGGCDIAIACGWLRHSIGLFDVVLFRK